MTWVLQCAILPPGAIELVFIPSGAFDRERFSRIRAGGGILLAQSNFSFGLKSRDEILEDVIFLTFRD